MKSADLLDTVETSPDISIVIPCYNSDKILEELIARVRQIFDGKINFPYEIILIDDGSPSQDTWPILFGLSKKHPEVVAVQLTRNFGKPSALICGYSLAKGKWIIAMDDDLQHLPEDIPMLWAKREHNLVMGQFTERHHPLWQRMTSNVKSWLDYIIIDKPKHVYLSPFHMIRRNTIDVMLEITTPTPHIGALMMYVTRDVAMVDVSHKPRASGKTSYTVFSRIKQFSNLLINNSSLLLKLVANLGISISMLSLIYGVYIASRRIFLEDIIEGWTSLMVITLIIGGVVMFSLGIVGEYLLRIINGLENRPTFIIEKRSK